MYLFILFYLKQAVIFQATESSACTTDSVVGNMASFIFRRMSLPDNVRRIYDLFSDVRYFGLYDFITPIYVIHDPDLITTITIKNFDNFCDHRNIVNEHEETESQQKSVWLTGRCLAQDAKVSQS